MKPVTNSSVLKQLMLKLCFNTCFLNQNKNCSVGDEIFHSKTSINIHVIKIYHNPVSVSTEIRCKQTEGGTRDKNGEREEQERQTKRGSGQIWNPSSDDTATLGMVPTSRSTK